VTTKKEIFGGTIRTQGVQERLVACKIFPNAGSAASFVSQGGVASVELSAAGKFLITCIGTHKALASFQATYVDTADNVDLYAQGGDVSNLGTTTPVTAVVKLKTGATNTNAGASDANRYISVDLRFEESAYAF
jgi:hypothetical protein